MWSQESFSSSKEGRDVGLIYRSYGILEGEGKTEQKGASNKKYESKFKWAGLMKVTQITQYKVNTLSKELTSLSY